MSVDAERPAPDDDVFWGRAAVGAGLLAAAVMFAPLATIVLAVECGKRRSWAWREPATPVAAGGAAAVSVLLVVLYLAWAPIHVAAADVMHGRVGGLLLWLVVLWLLELPATPAAMLATQAHVRRRQRTWGIRPEHEEGVQKAQAAARSDQVERWATSIVVAEAAAPAGLPLGVIIDGNDPRWVAQVRTPKGQPNAEAFVVPDDVVHHVVIGESGTGKTVTLVEWAAAALEAGDTVIYIDGKGRDSDQVMFAQMAHEQGEVPALWDRMPFDGWRGEAATVHERLVAMLTPEGSPDYYTSVLTNILAAVVRTSFGPPRNSVQFIERFLNPLPWCTDPVLVKLLEQMLATRTGVEQLLGAAQKALAVLNTLGGALDGGDGGWYWDTHRAIHVKLPSEQKMRSSAAVAWMVRDFDAWIATAERRAMDRRITLILDEAGAVASNAVGGGLVDLLERARSANVRVVLSAQSLRGLTSDDVMTQRIIGAGPALIGHRIGHEDSEVLAARAGTKRAVETGHQVGVDGQLTGAAAARAQDVFAVHPNVLKRQQMGEVTAVHGGRFTRAKVTPQRTFGAQKVNPDQLALPHTTGTEYERRTGQALMNAIKRLGLDELPGTEDEVVSAYRARAKEHHPDAGGDGDAEALHQAKEDAELLRRAMQRFDEDRGDRSPDRPARPPEDGWRRYSGDDPLAWDDL